MLAYHYILVAFRSFLRYKSAFFINTLALTLGIAVFIFIHLYLSFEYSFDQFHKDHQEVYRVATDRYQNGELLLPSNGAMPPLYDLIKGQIPQVQHIVRIREDGLMVAENLESPQKKVFEESKAYYSDPDFFQIFGFKLLQGNPETVLRGIKKIAISAQMAKKYFGTTDALGRTLRVTGQMPVDYVVTGVYQTPPLNSHFRPHLLCSIETYFDVIRPEWSIRTNWIWNEFPTYIKTAEKPDELAERISELAHIKWAERYEKNNVDFEFYLQPLAEIHLTAQNHDFERNANQKMLQWLEIIAFVVLIIAWINYINLSTIRLLTRSREAGIRKAIGARPASLRWQFLTEAIIVNLIAIALALLIVTGFSAPLAHWISIDFNIRWDSSLLGSILIILTGGLIAAIYPSVLLSRSKTIESLKGNQEHHGRGIDVRKVLVYIQFTVTPLLIGGTLMVQSQLDHLINRDLGADIKQVLSIKAPKGDYGRMAQKYDYFMQQTRQSAYVASTSDVMMRPGDEIMWFSWFRMEGDTANNKKINVNLAEYDFEKVFDLEVIAGRSFDPAFHDSTSFVINEAAAIQWQLPPEEIIGKTLRWRYSPAIPFFNKKVIGVVKNHIQESYSSEEVPVAYSMRRYTPASFASEYFVVKFDFANRKSAHVLNDELGRLEEIWSSLYPNDPFNYAFVDDTFQENFMHEIQFGRVIGAFTVLSLIIAGLGLFGLSSFTIIQRTKEIGIRKVLGASALRISKMIVKSYLWIACMAYLVALPALYFGSRQWLSDYAVRVEPGIKFFLLPIVLSIGTVLVSVIFQTLKAAHQNPTKSLRFE